MEVHHHPHVPHGRKKFKEYLLEFVMIFLAVTLGFMAESLREHISDKEKEREYIVSFVNNLKVDTMRWQEAIRDNQEKIDRLKQLMSLVNQNLSDTAVRRRIYENSNTVGFYSIFESNDATMMQLKNAGGLRLIHRKGVADSLAEYDNSVKAIYAAATLYNTASDAAVAAKQELLDYTIFYDTVFYRNKHWVATRAQLPFLTEDPKKIHWIFNKIDYEIDGTRNYVNNLREKLPFAIRLLAYLKKEYDLD